jgi:elongation factor P hydroxylase
MDEQVDYSRLLHGSGHGIALRKATTDIDVGDLCYWNPDGRATKILNVFDNAEVYPYEHIN